MPQRQNFKAMPGLKALIFDLDGTMADTEEVHRCAFNAAFADFDLGWHWSRVHYAELLAISGGRERLEHYARQQGLAETRVHFPAFIQQLHTAKTQHFRRMLRLRPVPLRTGVLRLLREARATHLPLAIATSSSLGNVMQILNTALPEGWARWFTVIGCSDVVSEKKPSPAVYQYVLDRLGVSGGECIAVEDTPNGHRAASAAGIGTVITLNGYTRNRNFPGALLVIDALGEPEWPFQAVAGDARNGCYVDLALLRTLLSSRSQPCVPRRSEPGIAPTVMPGPAP
ncbi:MAG: HAD-IA family hydrolase [Gammaproteobacteria bacterium]